MLIILFSSWASTASAQTAENREANGGSPQTIVDLFLAYPEPLRLVGAPHHENDEPSQSQWRQLVIQSEGMGQHRAMEELGVYLLTEIDRNQNYMSVAHYGDGDGDGYLFEAHTLENGEGRRSAGHLQGDLGHVVAKNSLCANPQGPNRVS